MTIKLMQGFDNIKEDADLRAQRWFKGQGLGNTVGLPAETDVPGSELALVSPYSASTNVIGDADDTAPGYYDLGLTVADAWAAGGFAFGCRAKFNSTVGKIYGGISNNTGHQVFNDGTYTWAIRKQGLAYALVRTQDYVTWELPPNSPGAINSGAAVTTLGANALAVIANVGIRFSGNNGVSWTTTPVDLDIHLILGQTQFVSDISWSTNLSYPMLVGIRTTNGGSLLRVSNSTASALTDVLVLTAGSSPRFSPSVLDTAGLITVCSAHVISYADPTSNLSLAGSWTSVTPSPGSNINDIAFFKDVWVAAGTSIRTQVNAGAPLTVDPPQTTGWTTAVSGVVINRLVQSDDVLLAIGNDGAIYQTTDGLTWESKPHINFDAAWISGQYDGQQFVLFADNGMIITSADGINNWSAIYAADGAEANLGLKGYSSLGVYSALTSGINTYEGSLTGVTKCCAVHPSTVAAGKRTLYLDTVPTANAVHRSVVEAATTQLWHYYEIVAIADEATPNAFFIWVFIDGLRVIKTSASFGLGNDTTDGADYNLILNIPRAGNWTTFDDLYFLILEGVNNTRLGPCNIVPMLPLTDNTVEWGRTGGEVTNAEAVAAPALSWSGDNSVTSSVAGDQDVYNMESLPLSGYQVRAVQAAGHAFKGAGSPASVQLGLVSGATPVAGDPTAVPLSTVSTYIAPVFETDPDTGLPWTLAAALASKLSVTNN